MRYRITSPVEHKVVTWVEYYVKGEKRRLRDSLKPSRTSPRPGEGVSKLIELRMQDGYKLSPEGKDKLRWDWQGWSDGCPRPSSA